MAYKVSTQAATKLFMDLEFPTAAKWSSSRLEKKMEGLPDVIDEDTDAGESGDLLEEVLLALDNDESVKVVSNDIPEEEEVVVEKYVGDFGETVEKKVLKKSAKKKPVKKKKTEKKKTEKKPTSKSKGVIATIVQLLEAASESKPISKDDLLEELIKECEMMRDSIDDFEAWNSGKNITNARKVV